MAGSVVATARPAAAVKIRVLLTDVHTLLTRLLFA